MKTPRRPRPLSGEERHLWGEVAKLITPLRGRAVLKTAAGGSTKAAAGSPEAASGAARATGGPEVDAKVGLKAGTKAATPPAPPSPPPAPVTAPRPVPAAPPRTAPKRAVKLGDLSSAPRSPVPAPPARASVAAPVPVPPPPAGGPGALGLDWRERRRVHRGLLPIEARIDLHGLYQAQAHDALVGFLIRARAAGHARVLVVTGKGGGSLGGSFGFEDRFSERGVLRRSVPHWLRGPELRGLVLGFEEAARHHGGAGALYVRLRRR